MKKIYLAIPYTGMHESSYEQANRATAEVMAMGYNPFSPITHSHPLTKYGVSQDWDFWADIDYAWIDVCDEVWVVIPEEGLDKVFESTGVQAEMFYAEQKNMPVRFFEYSDGSLKETEVSKHGVQ